MSTVVAGSSEPYGSKQVSERVPAWWHKSGSKMRLEGAGRQGKDPFILIASRRVLLEISAASADYSSWNVRYQINHDATSGVGDSGNRVLSSDELLLAFTRVENIVRRPGKFFRYGSYLNIPCAGTAQDGDPNVSLRIDEKIETAVRQLMARTTLQ